MFVSCNAAEWMFRFFRVCFFFSSLCTPNVKLHNFSESINQKRRGKKPKAKRNTIHEMNDWINAVHFEHVCKHHFISFSVSKLCRELICWKHGLRRLSYVLFFLTPFRRNKLLVFHFIFCFLFFVMIFRVAISLSALQNYHING